MIDSAICCSLDLDFRRMDSFSGLHYPVTKSLRPYILLTCSSKSWAHTLVRLVFVNTDNRSQLAAAKVYDYHPPMRLPDPESPDRSLGDCAICMDAITVGPPAGERGDSSSMEATWAGTAEGRPGGILSAVHRNVVGTANLRKRYNLAPCHHLFVSSTLPG